MIIMLQTSHFNISCLIHRFSFLYQNTFTLGITNLSITIYALFSHPGSTCEYDTAFIKRLKVQILTLVLVVVIPWKSCSSCWVISFKQKHCQPDSSSGVSHSGLVQRHAVIQDLGKHLFQSCQMVSIGTRSCE